jgi:hypothetical protein
MKPFVFYNPNPKQKFHKDGTPYKWKYGDCAIRAIARLCDLNWDGAFDLAVGYCRDNHMVCSDPYLIDVMMKDLGYAKTGYKTRERMKVKDFCKAHTHGRYMCNVAGHVVAVVNGKYYDAWDSGEMYVTSYYEKPTTKI